jgi:hypothetical protein
MFNDSKYTRCYFAIIQRARIRGLPKKASHCHHIVPRSLGGLDNYKNIVTLTPREHYIVHLLLIKMTIGKDRSKMAFALKRFGGKNKSKSFALASKLISESLSGQGNPMFGKKLTEEHRAKISGSNHGMFGTYCKDLWIARYGEDHAEQRDREMKAKRSASLSKENNPMYGKTWTNERKEQHINKLSGANHVNFGKPAFNKGRIWANNGKESKMILAVDLPNYIGWTKGRLPK